MDNKGSQFVLWNDSRYQYMVITQNMPMEEAVRIAESVTVCPADAPHPPQLTPKFGPPLDYPKDQAAANGDIVISGGEIENLSRLNAFFDEMASQKQTIIRVTDYLSLIHISEPTRQAEISYAVFCLKKKKKTA